MIEKLRDSIDETDEEILRLLSKRKDIVRDIAKLKIKNNSPIFDKNRENSLIEEIKIKAKENGLDEKFVINLFNLILENSKKEQTMLMPLNKNNKCSIGIIGFGRFGQLMAKCLAKDFRISVFDRVNKSKLIEKLSSIPSSLQEVCKKDIIILSVPISELENALIKIKPLLRKNSLVVDVCSVKDYPVEIMKKILPRYVQILATHPLFGPDTALGSTIGRKIVLCKIRIGNELYNQIKSFLINLGLILIETTPKKHDEEIAKSLVLTHFIGRSLMEMKASNLSIDTQGWKNLMEVLETVKHDTWQLFEDINRYNEYANKVRTIFIKNAIEINKRLNIRKNDVC